MRWDGQKWDGPERDGRERDGQGLDSAEALPGMPSLRGLVRSVRTPEFSGTVFHEVLARSALNHVPGTSPMPFSWTVNPYRGCAHACACFTEQHVSMPRWHDARGCTSASRRIATGPVSPSTASARTAAR